MEAKRFHKNFEHSISYITFEKVYLYNRNSVPIFSQKYKGKVASKEFPFLPPQIRAEDSIELSSEPDSFENWMTAPR